MSCRYNSILRSLAVEPRIDENASQRPSGEMELQCWPRHTPFNNFARSGHFQPVLAKHSKNFSLQNALSIGVDRMQRNFDGMRKEVDAWRESQLSDTVAKMIIYRAFIESDLEVPKHLAKPVHDLSFSPKHEEFQARTMWSLSNAFT
jgi:hypothetical protein